MTGEDVVIRTKGLTKDYGHGRGIFGIDLEVRRGEVFGFVGTNGSGKTTTIRHLMGFLKADSGTVEVLGHDAWREHDAIVSRVGYVPGEIGFPPYATGTDFLRAQACFLGVHDFTRMNHAIEVLQLDPAANLRRMSKGMKQKTAIVAALMAQRDVLLLDEPSTGLDPLMRDAFLDLVREERAAGHTVFMSSHIFGEMEEVCDRVAMIRDGRLVDQVDVHELRGESDKTFTLSFGEQAAARSFARDWDGAHVVRIEGATAEVAVRPDELNRLFSHLQGRGLTGLRERQVTLEDHFMELYRKGDATRG